MKLEAILPSLELVSILENGVRYDVKSQILDDVLPNALANSFICITVFYTGGAEFMFMRCNDSFGGSFQISAKSTIEHPTVKDLYDFADRQSRDCLERC